MLDFYERRARRILPALFFVILCTIPFAWFWMMPSQFRDFARSVVAVLFFVSNILFWRESGYFAPEAEEKPLLHTWSLAVEEQYYIVFPLFAFFLWRYARPLFLPSIIVVALGSLALSEWGWRNSGMANFYLAPTRAWELLAGSICAVIHFRAGRTQNGWLAGLGLGLILYAIFFYDELTPFPSLYALAPVGGTALFLLYAGSETRAGRLLSTPVPVAIGLVSYSAYLWHQPLFALARIRSDYAPSAALMAGLVVLTFALAWFSWRFVERPFRQRRGPGAIPARRLVPILGAPAAAFLAFGAYHSVGNSFEATFVARLDPASRGLYPALEEAQRLRTDFEGDNACEFHAPDPAGAFEARFAECAARLGKGVVVFGDSHSINLFWTLSHTATGRFFVGVGQGNCHPNPDGPNVWRNACAERFAAFVERHADQIEAIIYTQAGHRLLIDGAGHVGERTSFRVSDLPVYGAHEARIARVAAYLERLQAMAPVIWVGPRIEPHVKMGRYLEGDCRASQLALRPNLEENFTGLDRRLAEVAGGLPGIRYVSQIELMQLQTPQDLHDCEAIYWADGDHWSMVGERRFASRFAPILPPAGEQQAQTGQAPQTH